MTDQDVDFACLEEEVDDLLPMRLRYGTVSGEAGRHEPLELSLSREEPELSMAEQGVWDEVDEGSPGVARTHVFSAPDGMDEEQVAAPAEQDAIHNVVVDA